MKLSDPECKPGTLVRLISGTGPVMVIDDITKGQFDEAIGVRCVWFDKNDCLMRANLDAEVVKVYR